MWFNDFTSFWYDKFSVIIQQSVQCFQNIRWGKVEFIEEVTPQQYPLVEFSTSGNTPVTVFLEDSRGAAASLSRDFEPCSSP